MPQSLPPKPPVAPAGSGRPAPPPSPASRDRHAENAAQQQQLEALLTTSQRLEQSAQTSAATIQELRTELQSLSTQIKAQSVKELAVPPPLFTEPPPRPPGGVLAPVAAMVAAIAALGALAGDALLIREQKRLMLSQAESTGSVQALRQTVTQLSETVSNLPPPQAEHAPAAKPSSGSGSGSGSGSESETDPASPDSKAAACRPGTDKPKVLLPNLVGLRLAEARTAVAPLQLQLLPTDKKLKEASKIGWQLPNPGAELEPDEAVTVSLKPPVQKKKKKPG